MWENCAQEDLNFSTYLMFKPQGGIWVPLRLITWELHDEAMNAAVISGNPVGAPGDNETTAFPEWARKFSRF